MDIQWPKISIVTPSFNQGEFLEATIHSVLSQHYPNLEYIIIDGGSTDGSIEIIKKHEKHLHFWCSEPDEGHYHAINKGFTHATGDVMAWLNSDDMYFPWTLKTVGSIIQKFPQIEWLSALQPASWDWQGFFLGCTALSGFSRDAFLDGCNLLGNRHTIGWIQQESTFWQRSLWEKAGESIHPEYKLAGDFDLWARFFDHAELYGVNSALGGFRKQNQQRSRSLDSYIQEAQASLDAMRQRHRWGPNIPRCMILYSLLYKIPGVREIGQPLYRYSGQRLVRTKLDTPESNWLIEPYHFYKKYQLS